MLMLAPGAYTAGGTCRTAEAHLRARDGAAGAATSAACSIVRGARAAVTESG